MARIMSLLSLILLLGSMYYIHSQGILERLFTPSVVALQVNANIPADARIRANRVGLVPLEGNAPVGVLTFPADTPAQTIAEFLAEGRALIEIPSGGLLTSLNFGRPPEIWLVRALEEIDSGTPFEQSGLDVFRSDTADRNALRFGAEADAQAFFRDNPTIRSARNISLGEVLRLSDLAGSVGGGEIFVLRFDADRARGDSIGITNMSPVSAADVEVPRGALAFPSRSAAEVFLAGSARTSLAFDVFSGEVLVSEMLRGGEVSRVREVNPEETPQPETLEELIDFMSEFPDSIIFLDDTNLVGSSRTPGLNVDMWVETSRTEGSFGSVYLRRFMTTLPIQQVIDPEVVRRFELARQELEALDRSGVLDRDEEEALVEIRLSELDTGIYHFVNVGRVGTLAFQEARSEDRLSFFLASDTPLPTFFGNGVVCRGERCSASRSATQDLASIRQSLLTPEQRDLEEPELTLRGDPFFILEGVDRALAERFYDEGFTSFLQISEWTDEQIQLLTFRLEISRSQALFIRQQARVILDVPQMARDGLGITGTGFSR